MTAAIHWGCWGWDAAGSRCKTDEGILRRSNYGSLDLAWADPYQAGDKIRTGPVYFDDSLLIGSYDHKLHGIDVATGAALAGFPVNLHAPLKATPALFVLPGDQVVALQPSDDGNVYAVDARTGAILWTYPMTGPCRASPVIDHDNLIGYVGCSLEGTTKGALAALDLTDGSEIWNRIATAAGDSYDFPLSLFEGRLFAPLGNLVLILNADDGSVSSSYGSLNEVQTGCAIAVTPDDDAFAVFGSTDHVLYGFDPRTDVRRWIDEQAGDIFATPALSGPDWLMVDGQHNWRMEVAALEDDEQIWLKDADPSPPPSAGIQASFCIVRPSTDPLDLNDVLHFGAYMANDGRFVGWQTNRDDGNNPGFRFPAGSSRSLIDVFGSPIAANGHFFGARDDGTVYAFTV